MKKTINIYIFTLLSCIISNAQIKKIVVSEDAYVQGGETATETFGETKSKNLLIFNSKENSKYARISYLKFSFPKKMAEASSIELNLLIKIYKKDELPDLTFNLEVVGVNNDNWSESAINWDNKPELGAVLSTTEINQSPNNDSQWIKLKLDTKEFNKLFDGNKDRNVTIALVNTNFNKISAIAQSKESYSTNAAYLQID